MTERSVEQIAKCCCFFLYWVLALRFLYGRTLETLTRARSILPLHFILLSLLLLRKCNFSVIFFCGRFYLFIVPLFCLFRFNISLRFALRYMTPSLTRNDKPFDYTYMAAVQAFRSCQPNRYVLQKHTYIEKQLFTYIQTVKFMVKD